MQKLKYYYAIVTCNTKETASYLYDEYNGFEFENTNIRLLMSFVPDDLVFEQTVKQEATSVPPNYSFDHLQATHSRALGHTEVKLTWEQTDPQRTRKLTEGYKHLDPNDPEAEAEFYKEFIAGSSESDASSSRSEDMEEYRAKLLSGLGQQEKP